MKNVDILTTLRQLINCYRMNYQREDKKEIVKTLTLVLDLLKQASGKDKDEIILPAICLTENFIEEIKNNKIEPALYKKDYEKDAAKEIFTICKGLAA